MLDPADQRYHSAENQYLTHDFHRGTARSGPIVVYGEGVRLWLAIHVQRNIDAWTYSQLPRRSACNGSRGTSSTSTAPGLLFIYETGNRYPPPSNSLFTLPPWAPPSPALSRANFMRLTVTVDTSHGGTSRRPADVRRDRNIEKASRMKEKGG